MKNIWYILLLVGFVQPLSASSYIESVDAVIEQRIKLMTNESSFDVLAVSQQINSAIRGKVSLQAISELLRSNRFTSLFLLDGSASMQEIKFALGAKVYLYCLDCCERKMLEKSLENYDSLDYWQSEEFYENRNLLDKNIARWINGDSYKKSIHNKISQLESVSKQTTSFLGLIRHNKQILLQAFSRNDFEKNLMIAMKLQDEHLNDTAERDYEVCDIYTILTITAEQLHSLNASLSAQYAECKTPCHIQRNLVAYTATAAGLCACVVAYHMYKTDIDAYAQAAYKAGSSLWSDKVERPLTKMCNTLSGIPNEPLLDTTREETILNTLLEEGDKTPEPRGADVTHVTAFAAETEKATGEVIEYVQKVAQDSGWIDYGKKWVDYGKGWMGYPTEQAVSSEPAAPVMPDPVIVAPPVIIENSQPAYADMPAYEQEALRTRVTLKDAVILQFPEKNPRVVAPAMLRSVFSPILEIQSAINKLYEEHQFALSVAALLPFVAVAGGAVSASKNAYYSVAYKPVRRVIRDLDIFLNDSVFKPVSFDREGKLYFLTELLKQKCRVLEPREHKLITEDIAELQSKNLTYQQKFNTIQRMYHTYTFLLPGAI